MPALASWRLLVPAVVVTGLVVMGMVLVPSLDLGASSASTASSVVSSSEADHSAAPQVSRSAARNQPAGTKAGKKAGAKQQAGGAPAPAVDGRVSTFDAAQARKARKALVKQRAAELAALKKAREAARRAAMAKSSSFRVGTLNILGSQHTAGPGGYGPGTERAAISSGIIMARGVDVVTMSEVQDDQLAVLNNRLSGYSIWPQHELGRNGQRLQIAWRASQFDRIDQGSITYTFSSQRIPMPYVLLQDRTTGAQFWVISLHLSAGNLEGERDSGTAAAISLMRDLMARNGKPVIIGGDVNEHEDFFYDVCGALGFLGANGGGPGCALPPRPLRVDWIMGGGGDGVAFSGYVQDGSTLARASDHYFIHADTTVTDPGGTP